MQNEERERERGGQGESEGKETEMGERVGGRDGGKTDEGRKV